MFQEVIAHQTAMSKTSPLLNGENIGGDFATGAELNVIAAMHDHISCAKTVEQFNTQDTDEGKMAYPCDFDHMYATMTDSRVIRDENTEIIRLKELLLLHLDLIQQQSEQIVTKDKLIAGLRQENETLKQRLERMDRRVNLQKHKEGGVDMVLNSNSVPSTTILPPAFIQPVALLVASGDERPPVVEEEDQKPILLELQQQEQQQTPQTVITEVVDIALPVATGTIELEQRVEIEDETDCKTRSEDCSENKLLRPVAKRKRTDTDSLSVGASKRQRNRSVSLSSESSGKRLSEPKGDVKCDVGLVKNDKLLRTDDKPVQPVVRSVPDKRVQGRPRQRHKKRGHFRLRESQRECYLITSELYYSSVGEEGRTEGRLSTSTEDTEVEVPSWRHKIYTSCYSMEGTENLDDEVFNKRHMKQELDERRRKRWDIQRIREQRQYERLKQRQGERQRAGCRNEEEQSSLVSLWPDPDDVEYIEVSETVPVAVFGHPVTIVQKSEFSLPWLSGHSGVQSGLANNSRRRTELRR